MELLNNIQDKLWKSIFSFFYPVTDCTPIILIMISGLLATLFFLLRRNILHKTYTFGLLELPVLLSVSYMTEQLPRLHNRIQFALSTTAGIILQSSDYTKEFQTISDIQSLSNASISRYLYYLKDSEVFSEVMPEQLYYHLFKTLKDTRGFVGFFQVQNTSILLLLLMTLMLLLLLIQDIQKKQYLHATLLFAVGTMLAVSQNGVLITAFVFVFFECILTQIFPVSQYLDASS